MHESKQISDKESFVLNYESKSDYSNEEFFDALSLSILDESTGDDSFQKSNGFQIQQKYKGFRTFEPTDNFSNSSDEELRLIQVRFAQIEKFEKFQQSFHQSNKSNEETIERSDSIYDQAIINKNLRDELENMRNLNEALTNAKLNENQDERVDVSEEDLSKNNNNIETSTDNIDAKIKMNFTNENFKLIVENYDENDEEFTNKSNKKRQENILTKSNSFEIKSHDILKNSNTLTSITQTQDVLFKKKTETDYEKNQPNVSNQTNNSQIDEFINPVDKQIAAIFQMSSDGTDGHTNIHDSYSSSSTTDEEEDEEDEPSLLNKDRDETNLSIHQHDLENKSYNHSNTKKIIGHISNLDNVSLDASTSSSSSKKGIRRRTKKSFRKFFGNFVKRVQNKAEEVLNNDNDSDHESDSDEVLISEAANIKTVKYKAARSNKSSHDFEGIKIIQILNSNTFQLATTLNSNVSSTAQFPPKKLSSPSIQTASPAQTNSNVLRSFYHYFQSLIEQFNGISDEKKSDKTYPKTNVSVNVDIGLTEDQAPFFSKPFIIFAGHIADILDVSWSKSLFVLSASSDKTCRLWHIYKSESLCTFHHSSIVSCISFHPKDDRYFISACLDGKLRLWNISEKKVVLCNEIAKSNSSNFITAISFCQGGKTIAVGTFDGKCILFHTEHLKYYSLINVRSTKGRNSKGSKITGIEVLNNDENKILITSNDSRIRLYDLRDLSLVCKYRGFSNSTVHIKASLSPDDKFIVSGSKNKCTYIWKTNYQFSMLNSGRRDRNNYWERIQAHNAVVTCALFAPKPQFILNQIYNGHNKPTSSTLTSANYSLQSNEKSLGKNFSTLQNKNSSREKKNYQGVQVLVSAAGCDGVIKLLCNKLNL